jgi:hypothetical protein
LGRFWKVEENVDADIAHNAEKIEALSGEIADNPTSVAKFWSLASLGSASPPKFFRFLADIAQTSSLPAPRSGQIRRGKRGQGIVGDIPCWSFGAATGRCAPRFAATQRRDYSHRLRPT